VFSDKMLVWKIKHGCKDSMRRIYQTHKDDLLTLANALLNDKNAAEDIVHDVFVSFAAAAQNLQLRNNIKSYLTSSLRNIARDRFRSQKIRRDKLARMKALHQHEDTPEAIAGKHETELLLRNAVAQLPFEQREVVVLHLRGGLTFRQIAKMQNVSTNTAQGRYRYGIDKLRSILNGQVYK
jgi:RNA polymerase sigma factor (sigma-70 family)